MAGRNGRMSRKNSRALAGPGATPNGIDFGLWDIACVAGATMGIYHGYKRNQGSVGWALGWGALGAVLPIVAIPLMLAEGFAEPGPR